MRVIEIQCQSFEWWGEQWRSPMPYEFDAQTVGDHGLPIAPVTAYVMTPDPLEAAQLLRLLAAKLEREPRLLQPLNEPGNSPNNPAPLDDDGGCPF